jgi:hypothetical protein
VNDDVITWPRGFYIWPGFMNASQEGQMNIITPRRSKYEIGYVASKDILKAVEQNIQNVYIMPMLYINSGFRRNRFAKTVYEKTGALWNGLSQDIYMGLLNLFLYDRIPQLSHMVTVAGMANHSIGLQATLGNSKKIMEYDGIADTAFERQFPISMHNTAHYYTMLLRLRAAGVVSDEYIRSLDWGAILEQSVHNIDIRNPLWDRIVQGIEAGESDFAGLSGISSIKFNVNEVTKLIVNNAIGYQETDGGYAICVNSQSLGVRNIVDAVKYMEKRVKERWLESIGEA